MDLSFQRKGPKQPLSSVDFLVNIKSLFDEYLEYRPLEDRDTITDILSVIEDMFFDLTPNITRDYYYTVRNTDLIADIKTILTARQHENRLLAEKHNVSTDEVQAAIERLEFDTIAKSAPPAEDVTRAAAEVTASAIALTLPKVAPEFYADRLDKTESAPDFFTRVWGKWVDIIYQDDLGVRDRKLVRALRNYAYHHGISLSSILPPPKRVRTEKLAAEAREGSAEAAIARARLLGRGRAARFRQRKSQHS